ncbi:transcriptional regulator [Actinotalea sp. M2MS4P-6]|uniref:transcriptional regulator n=1 Tax=Actinotalea sp. M2MS4P-6 TaxID=2983762 RepID=UPI0021E46591|nr:transcriptional regulator [Actinotalea sp. M2MS4P-6]MCV2393897.1 transcriptional regulator [Actinotalea sp. M2MS4P-6]
MPDAELSETAMTLHAVRLLGFADTAAVARRYLRATSEVSEVLLDLEAFGWVVRSEFAGSHGWSLTERGRARDEEHLAAQLDATGARPAVADAYVRFLPANARFLDAVTRWQIRPLPGDPVAANDHTDHHWDDQVLDRLTSLGHLVGSLTIELSEALPRFDGYGPRFTAALTRALAGERRWVDGVDVDSCHTVWMQLHEDLLATLGLDRADES